MIWVIWWPKKWDTVENLAIFSKYRNSYRFRDTMPHVCVHISATVVNWEANEPILETKEIG